AFSLATSARGAGIGRGGRRGGVFGLDLVERQIEQVLAAALVDNLLRAGQDRLHRFQIKPLARDVGRGAVLYVDEAEALRVAGRGRDLRRLVAFGSGADARRFAARQRHFTGQIGLRVVDELQPVVAGVVGVVESLLHIGR